MLDAPASWTDVTMTSPAPKRGALLPLGATATNQPAAVKPSPANKPTTTAAAARAFFSPATRLRRKKMRAQAPLPWMTTPGYDTPVRGGTASPAPVSDPSIASPKCASGASTQPAPQAPGAVKPSTYSNCFRVVKHSWRGNYARSLIVSSDKITTHGSDGHATNSFPLSSVAQFEMSGPREMRIRIRERSALSWLWLAPHTTYTFELETAEECDGLFEALASATPAADA